MYARILVAIDGSPVAAQALEQGLVLAKALGSAVTIVHVAEVVPRVGGNYGAVVTGTQATLAAMVEAKPADNKLLNKALDAANAAGVEAAATLIGHRSPAEGIIEAAETVDADLIVMGTNGRRGLGRMILGSQASKVLQNAEVPVLVARQAAAPRVIERDE